MTAIVPHGGLSYSGKIGQIIRICGLCLSITCKGIAENTARNWLISPTKEIALCVDKLGWHDDIYVLPNESIGNSERLTVYQPPRIINHGYSTQGTLEQWKSELSSHLAEQSRFVFAISCGQFKCR